MKDRIVTVPDMALIAGTRVALGVGIGLLLSGKLREGARQGAGWALLAVGALTTIPLIVKVRTATRAGSEEMRSGHGWAEREGPATTPIGSPS